MQDITDLTPGDELVAIRKFIPIAENADPDGPRRFFHYGDIFKFDGFCEIEGTEPMLSHGLSFTVDGDRFKAPIVFFVPRSSIDAIKDMIQPVKLPFWQSVVNFFRRTSR